MSNKFDLLTPNQQISVNQFWKAVKEKKTYLKDTTKNNLSFLRLSENQSIIASYLFDNDYSVNTLATRFNDLGVVLRKLNLNGDVYIGYATELRDEYMNNEKEEDNILGYKTKSFKSFDFLCSRLHEFEEKIKTDKSRGTHFGKLILDLNLKQAPLRLELVSFDIIYNKNDNIKKDQNYLLIDGNDMYYIINNDKVSSKIENKPIKLSDEASKCILESLKIYPRNYLLTNATNEKKCSKMTYHTTYLRSILFPDVPSMSQNVFRRAYVSHHLKDASKLKAEKIASDMRTSEEMLRSIYMFRHPEDIPEDISEDTVEDIVEDIVEDKTEVKEVKKKFDVNEWGKSYRENNKDKIKDKNKNYYCKNKEDCLRKKIISRLNNGQVKTPLEESIKKYNLKCGEDGVWC